MAEGRGGSIQLRRQAVRSCREQGRTQDFVPVYLRLERHLHGVAGSWSTADGAPGKVMAICALRALTLMKTGSWETLAAGNALLSVLQFLSALEPEPPRGIVRSTSQPQLKMVMQPNPPPRGSE